MIRYFKRAEDLAVTWDDLADVGTHRSFDGKVANCFVKLAQKHLDKGATHYALAHDILGQQELAIRRGGSLTGVQILRLIFKHTEMLDDRGLPLTSGTS